MLNPILAELLNHIYDLEMENAALKDFIQQNEKVLRDNNAVVPGLPPHAEQSENTTAS